MTRAVWHRPSAGFLLIVASHLLLAVTLAWGFSRPELDQIWHIQKKTQLPGFTGLDSAETQLLKSRVERDPMFARALIGRAQAGLMERTGGGWTMLWNPHLVVRAQPAEQRLRIWIECRTAGATYPITVSFQEMGLREVLRFEQDGRQFFDLPPGQPTATLWADVLVGREPSGHQGLEPPGLRITSEIVERSTTRPRTRPAEQRPAPSTTSSTGDPSAAGQASRLQPGNAP
ncbi:hypothetical protein ACFL5O_02865 [Myxococcota bacterium]